jgi:hypothetical protein
MDIKILVAHHKAGFIYKDNIHEPIHVGKELSEIDLGILGDNTFENISNLNPFYCELTATYWAWKNVKTDYVGICHYRRYFYRTDFSNFFSKRRLAYFYYYLKSVFFEKSIQCFFFNQHEIQNNQKDEFINRFSIWLENEIITKKTKIFALKPVVHLNKNNLDHYNNEIGVFYMLQLDEIIKTNFLEYYPFFVDSLNSRELHYANMIIMDKFYYNEYCMFLFGVLEKHFELNQSESKNDYSRVSGYIGEILTNTYLLKKKQEDVGIELLNTLFIDS